MQQCSMLSYLFLYYIFQVVGDTTPKQSIKSNVSSSLKRTPLSEYDAKPCSAQIIERKDCTFESRSDIDDTVSIQNNTSRKTVIAEDLIQTIEPPPDSDTEAVRSSSKQQRQPRRQQFQCFLDTIYDPETSNISDQSQLLSLVETDQGSSTMNDDNHERQIVIDDVEAMQTDHHPSSAATMESVIKQKISDKKTEHYQTEKDEMNLVARLNQNSSQKVVTPKQLIKSNIPNSSKQPSTPHNKNPHVRVLDFDCTPNRFRLSEIDENKTDSIDVLSHFFTGEIINQREDTGYKDIIENLPEKLLATDEERSESERSVIERDDSFKSVAIETEKMPTSKTPKRTYIDRILQRPTQCDPTEKASNLLIEALLEQKEHFERQNAKKTTGKTPSHHYTPRKMPKFTIKRKGESKIETNDEDEGKRTQPKEKKIKIGINDGMPNGFGNLILKTLQKNDVHAVYLKIEQGQNASFIKSLEEKIADGASDSASYIEAYKAMLNLEEAAETLNLQNFNQRSIQLTYSNFGKTFEIKKDVICH